jgi:hypothetical protein
MSAPDYQPPANVIGQGRFPGRGSDTVATGGNGPHDPGMEARVAVLEQIAKSTEAVLGEIRLDVREVRKHQEQDFRILFGVIVSVALGLAAIMAKGFRWL